MLHNISAFERWHFLRAADDPHHRSPLCPAFNLILRGKNYLRLNTKKWVIEAGAEFFGRNRKQKVKVDSAARLLKK